jgi:dephospho-CoA kinase
MRLLGLTGGVGMGKTTTADFLRRRGLPVVDTDLVAREVVEPGQPALEEIARRFGPEVLDAEGRLRRDRLARLVFPHEEKRRQLESIVHPRIRDRWRARIESWRREGKSAAVVVIPLLFETKAESEFDVIVCTACSGVTQRKRLAARGWSGDQIEQRIQAQWPIEKKLLESHFVVWTEAPLKVHAAQVDRILRCTGFKL